MRASALRSSAEPKGESRFLLWLGGGLAFIFILLVMMTGSEPGQVNRTGTPPGTQTRTTRTQATPAEYKLAVVDAQRDPPPAAAVTAIRRDLNYLWGKCTGAPSREGLTDMALGVVRQLKQNDGKVRSGQFVLDWTAKLRREPVMQEGGTCSDLFTLAYFGIKALG